MCPRRRLTIGVLLAVFLPSFSLIVAQNLTQGASTDTAGAIVRQAGSFPQLRTRFEANVGQYPSTLKFVARQRDASFALTQDALLINAKSGSPLRIRLLGASENARVAGEALVPDGTNYFVGREPEKWETAVPTYERVRYHEIYRGVDLVYYCNEKGELEHDFEVGPGGSSDDISLEIAGYKSLDLRADGNVFINGGIELRRPVAYQQIGSVRQDVEAHYVIHGGNKISIAVGNYDRARSLVIDPVVVTNAVFGGSSVDVANAIAIDPSGNAIVAGTTYSADFQFASTAQGLPGGGANCGPFNSFLVCSDAFVAKVSPAGNILYFTYLGGSQNDIAASVAVDGSGNAYVTGTTQSSDFPVKNAFQSKLGGGMDCGLAGEVRNCPNVFLTKLNSNGAIVYSTYLGGAEADYGQGVAVTSGGVAWVTGSASSANLPVTSGAFRSSCTANSKNRCSDGFAARFTTSGTVDYLTYLDGAGTGVFAGSSGVGYVTGTTSDSGYTTTASALLRTLTGSSDAFAAEIDPSQSGSASLVYSTLLGTNGGTGSGVLVDATGKVYITAMGPTIPQLMKMDFTKTGALGLLYTTQLAYPDHSAISAPALDSSGNVYVAGTGEHQLSPLLSPEPAAYISEFNSSGVLNASDYYYNTFSSSAQVLAFNGIALDSNNTVYVGGTSTLASSGDILVESFASAQPTGLQITPSPLVFPDKQSVSSLPQANISIKNNGTAPDTISGLVIPSGFTKTDGCSGLSIPVGSSCIISLFASTHTSGMTAGQVTFNSASTPTSHNVYAYILQGNPSVSFSPTSLNFGSVVIGNSVSKQATLTNSGDGIYPIGIVTAPGLTETHDCGRVLPAKGVCNFTFTFSPHNIFDSADTIVIDPFPNFSTYYPEATLFAAGSAAAPPGITLSPTNLQFPTTAQGVASQPMNVTFANTTTASIPGISFSVSGDFAQTNTCGATQSVKGSLAASSSCTVSVTFTPTTSGVRTGVLTENNVNGNLVATRTVTLVGNGSATPTIGLSSSSLPFGSQVVGTTSAPNALTITNTSTAANLQISSISVASPYSESDSCSNAIAPGQVCNIAVMFSPSTTGSQSGQLVINSNGAQQKISLSGTGTLPVPAIAAVSPASIFNGSPNFSITVTGSNFSSSSVVQWVANSTTTSLTTSYVNSTTLQATVTSALVTAAGSAQVKVFTSTPGGGTSAAKTFTITTNNPPTGALESALYQGSFTTTVPQGGVVHVSGWAADTDQGSPVANVQVSINPGTGTGTATQAAVLGGLRTDIVTSQKRSDYLHSGWTADIPTTGLTAGTFNVSAVATDSAGATTTLPSTQSITVSGTANGPVVGVSAQTLSFGSMPINGSSQQMLTITNVGTGSLTVSSVQTSGSYKATSACGSALAESATCQVTVTFHPTASGTANGTLTINSNGSPAATVVNLTGSGTVPTPSNGRPPRPVRNLPL